MSHWFTSPFILRLVRPMVITSESSGNCSWYIIVSRIRTHDATWSVLKRSSGLRLWINALPRFILQMSAGFSGLAGGVISGTAFESAQQTTPYETCIVAFFRSATLVLLVSVTRYSVFLATSVRFQPYRSPPNGSTLNLPPLISTGFGNLRRK